MTVWQFMSEHPFLTFVPAFFGAFTTLGVSHDILIALQIWSRK